MSKIEVDAIDKQSGSTLTIGGSGTAVTLACGATQSGFGRSGSVDWQTSVKTSDFTAANGEGYFVDTSSGAVTVTLPSSPSAGNIVAVSDYAQNADTNNITIARNGSNIQGSASNLVITNDGVTLTLVYADSTKGWIVVAAGDESDKDPPPAFIEATGGTITTSGNCKIHTFTGPGTFAVSQISTVDADNTVSYMVVAGGGGGGSRGSGAGGGSGGGGGGFREIKSPTTPYTASPLDGYPSSPNRITITAASFPVTVGAGGSVGPTSPGSPSNTDSSPGSNSQFSTITAAGGGGGRGGPCNGNPGQTGGSGSGGSGGIGSPHAGGAGNTPPVTPSQGNPGGTATTFPLPGNPEQYSSAGGGGATAAGANAQPGPRAGGAGAATSITASPVTYSAGGNGALYNPPNTPGTNQSANTGNGGPGGNGDGPGQTGGTGGSGLVIIRYKYQ